MVNFKVMIVIILQASVILHWFTLITRVVHFCFYV